MSMRSSGRDTLYYPTVKTTVRIQYTEIRLRTILPFTVLCTVHRVTLHRAESIEDEDGLD